MEMSLDGKGVVGKDAKHSHQERTEEDSGGGVQRHRLQGVQCDPSAVFGVLCHLLTLVH